ncbi:hypothetical protein [Mesoplasma photuris]|uniref:hypothetical protein n=1 Tax=Mesoplasma photuris TaxID=217731 RepID=UPI0004E10A50|nr:hypothetical protein [Mesoplasma photuris]
MAIIDKEKQMVVFDQEEYDQAWDAAPKLINKPEEEFRLCYTCQFHIIRNQNDLQTPDGDYNWSIDLINIKKPELTGSNYIAVHSNCIPNRKKDDARKLLKKYYAVQWKYDEENDK